MRCGHLPAVLRTIATGRHSINIDAGLPLSQYFKMELSYLTWTEQYTVGHRGLDAEHRKLVEVINEICLAEHAECSPDEFSSLVNRLTLLAVEHFEHENAVMHEFNFSTSFEENSPSLENVLGIAAINEHCAQHAEALVALESIILAASPRADFAQRHSGQKLISWFTAHAIKHDAELRVLFQSNFAARRALRAG
jgi:hemerythrin